VQHGQQQERQQQRRQEERRQREQRQPVADAERQQPCYSQEIPGQPQRCQQRRDLAQEGPGVRVIRDQRAAGVIWGMSRCTQ
jgi:hypothetical protein